MSELSRRLFVSGSLAAAALAAAPAYARGSRARGAFTHGVASGDPMATSVVLWTRFLPQNARPATLGWEVAEDEAFKSIAAKGSVRVAPITDFCGKVIAAGLKPGRPYFYRFLAASGPSVIGQTRTAPEAGVDALKLALFSCSNMPFGYFRAYAHAAADPSIELCVHVGDYIYEYQPGKYPSKDEAVPGRIIKPDNEIVSWNDYHQRYQSYRADPDLQELHRTKPWIMVWDDHELANNAWMNGAEEHDPPEEGTWTQRLANAARAYADWTPTRMEVRAPWRIYRSYDWGTLATIHALDTRYIGRDEQLDYAKALGPAMATKDMAAIAKAAMQFGKTELADPKRSLLGAAQEAWLDADFARSKARGATWQILAQQLVTGPQRLPADIASLVGPNSPPFVRQFAGLGGQLGAAGFEWNLDSWGGYPAARARLVESALKNADNALILSGDSHNAWVYDIPGGPEGRAGMIEAAGTSVTSPGFETFFNNAKQGEREAKMRAANPELVWADVTNKGYCAVTLTRAAAEATFIQYADVRAKDAPVTGTHTLRAAAVAGPGVGKWQTA
jgi:alkaline phosphatase D